MEKAYAAEAEKNRVIEQLLSHVRDDGPPALARFLSHYYRGVAAEDLLAAEPEALLGAGRAHWQLLRQEAPGPRIRVFNPEPAVDGWQSRHTLVQLVTDDMPYLVDSVTMALDRRGLTIHLVVHPVVPVDLQQVGSEAPHVACLSFEVDRLDEASEREALAEEIAAVLEDVRVAVADWQPMRGKLLELAAELPPDGEEAAFLSWLAEDHFTFLGYRCYELLREGEDIALRGHPESSLGLLRHGADKPRSLSFAALPATTRQHALSPDPLIVTKSNSRSPVHRPSYMDYIGIKRFDAHGEVIGEHRFLGLYSTAAYSHSPRSIPLLRRKIDACLERAALPPRSHAGKALTHILETYPRDELFQIEPEALYGIALGILQLQERRRTRLFVRLDTYRRYVSCLVFVPRQRYDSAAGRRMQAILQRAFDGVESEYSARLSESVLARVHYIVRLAEPGEPEYDHAALEAELARSVRSWHDDFDEALRARFGETRGKALLDRYRDAFTAAYREDTETSFAARDSERLEALSAEAPLAIRLYRPPEGKLLRLKLYHLSQPITLSEILPMLENMGVSVIDERPYRVQPLNDEPRWIHDFGLRPSVPLDPAAGELPELFQEALGATWHGRAEDDGFNRLVLHAGLDWERIGVLRAYCKYLRQAGTTLSQRYVEDTLAAHPEITRRLVELFYVRLDPERQDLERADALAAEIEAGLATVARLDDDRILRRYLAAILATLRCNHFRRDGGRREFLSLKLAPAGIPDLPQPHPAYEIFVCSPRFEGTHLRGGKVARGGIRHSDRHEDFRTEILGLLKAQTVKNAVIVPVGAKGGFVPKRLPAEREAAAAEARACYAEFIRGLLDLTDNRVDGRIVPPPQVVRFDDDDPYLVVAADKGTAGYSDLANSVSAEYGFWLRDAFASGGSSGYDHKKMGITARGAWESVKRHFRELGVDAEREPITAVGIGDMSGDVFGNGMLRSPHLRLLAAFDHRHVFIDPDPDVALAYAERERLFKLPRSSWADYDPAKLSAGGGVYPRSQKSIELSEAAQRALGIDRARLSPTELIRAVLRAPVDLLWNGGIGTYVKATDESHADVGDKTNDSVRVNGGELRCRVVGEGGNLGFSQRGRIEYALSGGHINTDAIDNSGGVDCSDHEVNIKILLNEVVDRGELGMEKRDALLAGMTDEVAALVLRHNYRQTRALSLAQARGAERLDLQRRFIRQLEREGALDRALEFLPDEEELAARQNAGQGLTRPELAVLLAYAKIGCFQELLEDDLLDEPYLERELFGYFPTPLREGFAEAIRGHRLRREIIASALTNELIDRMGVSFVFRLRQHAGVSAGETVRAHLVAREVFELSAYWAEVDALDNRVPAQTQTAMLQELIELQQRAIAWLLLKLPPEHTVEEAIAQLRPTVAEFSAALPQLLAAADRDELGARAQPLEALGVPAALAWRVAAADALFAGLDIAGICHRSGAELSRVGRVYFFLAQRLQLGWLRRTLDEHRTLDPWQERLRRGLEDEVYSQLARLTEAVIGTGAGEPEQILEHWLVDHARPIERLEQLLSELRGVSTLELPMLAVAVDELKRLGTR